MEREFLENLMEGMPAEVVDAILQQNSREVFTGQLRAEIARQGGRSVRAIEALLDTEALLGSDDREAAVRTALKNLRAECGYLFESPVPPRYAPNTGAPAAAPDEPQSLAAALRERFEKK